eukprot:2860794-Heterocapsa_arctica.AAC.1
MKGTDKSNALEGVQTALSLANFHAVPTWWNGKVYAVYTNYKELHTDPIFWERGGILHTGVNNIADPLITQHTPALCCCHDTSRESSP